MKSIEHSSPFLQKCMSCSKCDKLFKENHLEVLNVLKVSTMHPVAPLDIYFFFALVKWLPTQHLPTIHSDYHFSEWPRHFHNSSSVKTFVPVNTSVWKQAATSAHQNYRPWRFLFITIWKKQFLIHNTLISGKPIKLTRSGVSQKGSSCLELNEQATASK